jgi:hypothetical protein
MLPLSPPQLPQAAGPPLSPAARGERGGIKGEVRGLGIVLELALLPILIVKIYQGVLPGICNGITSPFADRGNRKRSIVAPAASTPPRVPMWQELVPKVRPRHPRARSGDRPEQRSQTKRIPETLPSSSLHIFQTRPYDFSRNNLSATIGPSDAPSSFPNVNAIEDKPFECIRHTADGFHVGDRKRKTIIRSPGGNCGCRGSHPS